MSVKRKYWYEKSEVFEKIDVENQSLIQAAQWHNTKDDGAKILHNRAFFNYTHTLNRIRKQFKTLLKRSKVSEQEKEFVNNYLNTNTKMLVNKYGWNINFIFKIQTDILKQFSFH